jgi:hypothetical protein
MTLKQFKETYPEYKGYIFINGNYFIDKRFKDQLEYLKVDFIELYLISLESTFLNWFQPDIGINFGLVDNDEILEKYSILSNVEKLKNFIDNNKVKHRLE